MEEVVLNLLKFVAVALSVVALNSQIALAASGDYEKLEKEVI